MTESSGLAVVHGAEGAEAASPATGPALAVRPDADLVVLVLQWGRADETLRCLSALERSRGVRPAVIVADNRSPERDAPARIRSLWPQICVVENPRNLGFAEGNNVVLRSLLAMRAGGRAPRWCLLLNNDVEVEDGCLREMLDIADERGAAAVGALNLVRGSHELGSSGGFIRWPSGRYRDVGAAAVAAERAVEVETLAGSTLLLDLDVLQFVGVLDPDYFCVYEETDLCLRIRRSGHRLLLATRARARHAVGASTSRKVHLYFRFRNRIPFVRRHGGRGALLRMLPGLLLELGWRLPAYALTGRFGDFAGVARGTWDGFRGVTGPGPFVAE